MVHKLMPFDRTPLQHQAALEVKYAKGMVYFDKCGSTLTALTAALEEPFRTNGVPGPEYAETVSAMELLVVRFGHQSLNVTQRWFETIARFHIAARVSWGVVSKALGVGNQVTRCGARYWFLWSVPTREQAETLIRELGLFQLGDSWTHLLQLPTPAHLSPVAVIPWESGKIRVSLDVITSEPQGYQPKELAKFAPKHGVMLDLDFVLHDGEAKGLTENSLHDFCVSSSAHAKTLAGRFGEVLETCA